VIDQVKVSLRVTSTTGFINTPGGDFRSPTVMLILCGSGQNGGGCTQTFLYHFNGTAQGNSLGGTCGDFVFDTTSSNVFNGSAPGTPPFSGTYQLSPTGLDLPLNWLLKDAKFGFSNTGGHPPDAVLQCARIDITTKIVPVP